MPFTRGVFDWPAAGCSFKAEVDASGVLPLPFADAVDVSCLGLGLGMGMASTSGAGALPLPLDIEAVFISNNFEWN
jgi:hypothetical protein